MYCAIHRYADKHTCTFDFKTHAHAILTKNNEKVVASKIDKL